MTKIKTLLLLILLAFGANAQTNVTADIANSSTWTAQFSPYIIKNNITIQQGATLTIQNGVEVRVDTGLKVVLRGGLVMAGQLGDSVHIHASQATTGRKAWYGVQFFDAARVNFNYAIFENAEWGLDYWYDSVTVGTQYITNSRFSHNTKAICNLELNRPMILVDICTFNQNNTGVTGAQCDRLIVKRSNFFNNLAGIGDTQYVAMVPTIDACDIHHNVRGIGMYLYGGGSVSNSYIHDNSAEGVFFNLYAPQPHSFSYNQVYNNKIGMKCVGQVLSDSLDGGLSAFCNNTVDFANGTSRSFTLSNACWCSNDTNVIRSHIKDAHNTPGLGPVKFNSFVMGCALHVLGIEEEALPGVSVYPNPAKDKLYIQGAQSLENMYVTISNVLGQTVYSAALQKDGIDVSALKAGLYQLTLQDGRGRHLGKKLIVSE